MIFLDIGFGRDINQAIEYAISEAKKTNESQTFDFNGVTIIVCDMSNASLIYRDWNRGMSGYLGERPIVGPFSSETLSNEQLESDRKIQKENDAKYKLQQEKWAQEAIAKKNKLNAALSSATQMEFSNKPAWDKFVEANQDSYGSACIRYAEKWAMLMQVKIKSGASVASCASETGSLADSEGITGFMYGCAVSMLAQCWKHGEELRRWHNKDVQLGTEGDAANDSGAVLNPACLVISN